MRDRRSAIVAIFILSGASGLIYEVVWSRQLVLVFGNTTQAIAAILTGYFGGMAVGSLWVAVSRIASGRHCVCTAPWRSRSSRWSLRRLSSSR